jgi:hypothetical protein
MPTTHEPCLYSSPIDGKRVVFMRQVKDFAIAAPKKGTANILLDMLDDELTMPIKRQGLLNMFNGINVVQTGYFIEIDCHTYVNKMCMKYLATWLSKVLLSENRPTPLPSDADWIKGFNATTGPSDSKEQAALEASMQLKYRAGIGEIIWAMTTCRLDIFYGSVKLSQSISNPAEIHLPRAQTYHPIPLHHAQ